MLQVGSHFIHKDYGECVLISHENGGLSWIKDIRGRKYLVHSFLLMES